MSGGVRETWRSGLGGRELSGNFAKPGAGDVEGREVARIERRHQARDRSELVREGGGECLSTRGRGLDREVALFFGGAFARDQSRHFQPAENRGHRLQGKAKAVGDVSRGDDLGGVMKHVAEHVEARLGVRVPGELLFKRVAERCTGFEQTEEGVTLELPDGRAIPCDRHQGVAGGTVAERGGKHRSIIADRAP